MADQTREAIDARYAVTESLKGLIYGPHYSYLAEAVQGALVKALEAVEESEDITPEDAPGTSMTAGQLIRRIKASAEPLEVDPDQAANVRAGYAAALDQEQEHGNCVRCGRDVPRWLLRTLTERAGGGLACAPVGDPSNYDECQRIYNTV